MKNQKGQIFIEIIITVGLLTILFHAVFTLVNAGFQSLGDTRARQTARHIGQGKLEEIKNMNFDDIGTQGGVPTGSLLQAETVNQNGLDYLITTSVVFVDDPFDGLAPADLLPTDYKRVRVEVSWSGLFSSNRPMILVTDISPEGIEEPVSGGTIDISVFDANVEPITNAQVQIINDTVNPPINMTLETNDQGKILLPGAPACANCYFLEATKDGYTSDRTYSFEEVANPNKAYLTVEEAGVSEISLIIDKVSELNILSDQPNINFHLTSLSKIIGTDTQEEPVYKLDQDYVTDESGALVLEDFEWGNYGFELLDEDLDFAGSNPFTPISILPDEELEFSFVTRDHENNTLLIKIMDVNDQPIASASARLFDDGDYDEATFSGQLEDPDAGQVFFSPLEAGDYTLETEAEGYQPDSREINVSDQAVEQVILEE